MGLSFGKSDVNDTAVATDTAIDAHLRIRNEISEEFELVTFHVVCADWWVVADLLVVDWNTSK